MYIASALPDFRQVRIRKSGGFAGVDQTLVVDADLNAKVTCRRTGERTLMLDAFTAQELMQALARVVREQPRPSSATGADMFHYDIELTWNGTTYRVRSVDVGADDALHGVMFAANRLMSTKPDDEPFHIMGLHDVPSDEPPAGA